MLKKMLSYILSMQNPCYMILLAKSIGFYIALLILSLKDQTHAFLYTRKHNACALIF